MKIKFAAFSIGLLGLVSQLQAATAALSVVCPLVYEPSTCSYEEYTAEGTNSCFARLALQKQLDMKGIVYDANQIRCVSAAVVLLKAAKPACGIVPTSISCAVVANNQVWETSALGCESPIPELLQQLHTAGIENTNGLTAICQQSQPHGDREYTVPLF